MRTYACQCGTPLFFGNRRCVECELHAGWCDVCATTAAVSVEGTCLNCDTNVVACTNRTTYDVCNCFVDAATAADGALCRSCQMTTVAPDPSVHGNLRRWQLLEAAKRRLLYDLRTVGYPDDQLTASPPLTFRFLSDTPEKHVVTGHADGVITINTAEADPVHRESTRQQFGEPHRTLIGHMRHETGHFFWMREIVGHRTADATQLFGDADALPYAETMKQYYDQGPPEDWNERYISTYASSHPWEDFAETYAFYLDMRAVLDTLRWNAPHLVADLGDDLPAMLLSYCQAGIVLNEINRTMGLTDLVPEVVPPPVVAKLQFVHDVFEKP
ncbi:putative zinc-binding metallopeptidase [Aeoliella sp.]|uniref:putative zinc-binding metallopeptidase n=1 Tax=Aeoliella sp. TaxID=2795800 RepID=UPI003CCC36F5